MKCYDAIYQGDILTADIHDSALGGVRLIIFLQRQGRDPELIHIGNFDTYENAEKEMREIFPDVHWR